MMKKSVILFFAVLFPIIISLNLSAQIRRMVGTIIGVRYQDSGEIMFGVITREGPRFIGRTTANCNWIIEGKQININVSKVAATIDNGQVSCPLTVERVVK